VHFEVTDGELTDFENITIIVRGISVQIAVEPENFTVQPQAQFDVNITVDPRGNPVYGIQYRLRYNTSVLRAETQTKGPLLGKIGETIIITNSIDHANGIISYAETRKGDIGGVTLPGILATVHFTAIQQGANTSLNLSNVIVVDVNASQIEPVELVNGSVYVKTNIPPVAIAKSIYRYNNVGERYLSKTYFDGLASYDPDGNISYYRWAFGDGSYGTGGTVDHIYNSWRWNGAGYDPFIVSLTVEDDGTPTLDNTTHFPVDVYIAGDANGDGIVDIFDAVILGLEWDRECTSGSWTGDRADRADLNNDCIVDVFDAVIVGANWDHTAW